MNSRHDISLLYDFYGALLQDSQQRVIELYVNDDLSLSEVADILQISRQGVRDSLTRASRKLNEYEQKLGLLRAYQLRAKRYDAIRMKLQALRSESGCDQPLIDEIEELLKGDD